MPLPDGVVPPPKPAGADGCEQNANACSLFVGNKLKSLDSKLEGYGNKLQNIFNSVTSGFQLADLYLLKVINDKLGSQVPGGISGFLGRILLRFNKVAEWLHLGRVLSILTWVQTLHNAYMLSNNLGQTLLGAISNTLAAIGIKDAEGQPLNISEILGGQIDSIAKGVLGVTTWEEIKAEWKRANRIYQAAANIVWAFQSIGQSILNALEVVGSWIASVGNALRKFGVVGERAYGWMNPTPNFDNKFFTGLEAAENVVSQIDTVASEVLSVQETITQIGQQKAELQKAIGQEEGTLQKPKPPEAVTLKAGEETAKTVSQGAVIDASTPLAKD